MPNKVGEVPETMTTFSGTYDLRNLPPADLKYPIINGQEISDNDSLEITPEIHPAPEALKSDFLVVVKHKTKKRYLPIVVGVGNYNRLVSLYGTDTHKWRGTVRVAAQKKGDKTFINILD